MVLFGMGLSELNSWGSLREGHIRMGLNGVNLLLMFSPYECGRVPRVSLNKILISCLIHDKGKVIHNKTI